MFGMVKLENIYIGTIYRAAYAITYNEFGHPRKVLLSRDEERDCGPLIIIVEPVEEDVLLIKIDESHYKRIDCKEESDSNYKKTILPISASKEGELFVQKPLLKPYINSGQKNSGYIRIKKLRYPSPNPKSI